VTNLCIGCHVDGGGYNFMTSPKHPSDNYNSWLSGPSTIVVNDPAMAVNQEGVSSSANPTYDPATKGVGVHIDQYVDHWAWWGNAATTDTNDDIDPFLPLGDSLAMVTGGTYDNDTADRVTCITCHNPHGTDLHVANQDPGVGSSFTDIPANKMLRLRDDDAELCAACHK